MRVRYIHGENPDGVDTNYPFPHGQDTRDDLESSGSCKVNMDTKKGHDRPHLLDAQLIHWLIRLPPLAVLVRARVRTESSSMLLLASVDPDKRRGELGTGGGEGIEGERGVVLVGLMILPTTVWVV